MDVREKLVELFRNAFAAYGDGITGCTKEEFFADFIACNGVTVQEQDGCEYCKHGESVYHNSSGIHDSMDEDVYISGNNIVVDIGRHSYGTAEIKFCPMCGRELPQPPKGE